MVKFLDISIRAFSFYGTDALEIKETKKLINNERRVKKCVYICARRQEKWPTHIVKRFLLYPEIRNRQFQKIEKGERQHDAHLFCIATMQFCIVVYTDGVGLLYLFQFVFS